MKPTGNEAESRRESPGSETAPLADSGTSQERSLRRFLEDDEAHLVDGAMGTVLYDRGVFVNVCYDALVLDQPELVEAIHREYVEAGAQILETNTFGANPVKLSAYGLEDRTEELNRAAAKLARKAASDRAFVLGAVGPLGVRLEPWGPTAVQEAEDFFRRQMSGLLEGGADGIILETFADLHELETALRTARSLTDLPVFAQFTVGSDGTTALGTDAVTAALQLQALGADVVGLNCSVGPAAMLDTMELLAETLDVPLSAQPNAGLPRTVGDRKMYLASPEYMARYGRRFIQAGVRFVGGCCGTTPEHTRHMARMIRGFHPRHPSVQVDLPEEREEVEPAYPLASRSEMGERLAQGRPVFTVELTPPHGWDTGGFLEAARRAKKAGAHAIGVLDSTRGRSRMAALPAAGLILREVGIEPLMHYTCRDRNMMGMLSDLLGAAADGIRNLLLVSGDPPVEGPYADATHVFDIDSIGLTNVVNGLNQGVDPGGASIGSPTPFVVGVAANPGAVDRERELRRFTYKLEAGADFAVTQPLFDPETLHRFRKDSGAADFPIIVGIWPFLSLRNAEFLANEVPGVQVPDWVLDRMRRAAERGPEAARAEGVALALEVARSLQREVDGFHISTPGGDVTLALSVLEGLEPVS
ncbi:MAG: bifunctional homocysteine S-methyltransferase/methylenetetrahydrofolate reductase [Gemmatimonadales bacterium]|nr:MAG: bifunctional homocysteine S-methyltransferase/methylenetetrahydrofolate reductase [Gemmatimonadales bacterium]